jgi:predicted transcriptional regulator
MERMTISVPTKTFRQIEAVRKAEKRTRSGVIQEALRRYSFGAEIPATTQGEEATPAERRAVARGHAAIEKGEYVSLDEVIRQSNAVDRKRRKARSPRA